MNLLFQGAIYFSMPKAFARRLQDPVNRTAEVETSAEGVRIASGPNAALLTWARFKHIWMYDDFVILAVKPAISRFTFLPTSGMSPEMRRDLQAASEGKRVT
jgi:hypothetical protein